MPNYVKYSTSIPSGSLLKGTVALGVTTASIAGPTSTTNWYAGITPASGKYVIYKTAATGDPDIFCPQTNQELFNFVLMQGGSASNITSVSASLDWIATQTNLVAANFDYENIVTDGLVLNLDAGFIGSYPTTASTWYDISGNNTTGSLINGPTYNSANSGSIVFDGVDDYAAVSNFVGNLTTFSVSHFIYLNSTQNTRTIFSNYGVGNNGWVTGIRDDQNNVFKFYLGATVHLYSNTVFSNSTWYHAAITYDNGSPKIYINGILDASSSSTLTPASSYYGNDVGRLGVGSQYFNGRISNLQVYNRALSAAEVLQNYNAQKGRFGL